MSILRIKGAGGSRGHSCSNGLLRGPDSCAALTDDGVCCTATEDFSNVGKVGF